jgi:hypothetical protein
LDVLRKLIDCLLDSKPLSNAAIAKRIGCERRRVGRYRKLLKQFGLSAADLNDFTGRDLDRLFNTRARARAHRQPDFTALSCAYPGATARFCYEQYRDETLAARGSAMSYPQFNRERRHHEAMERARELVAQAERDGTAPWIRMETLP